jgi:hypothetical protein
MRLVLVKLVKRSVPGGGGSEPACSSISRARWMTKSGFSRVSAATESTSAPAASWCTRAVSCSCRTCASRIRQHTSAYAATESTSAAAASSCTRAVSCSCRTCIRQHTSAYVSMRCVSLCTRAVSCSCRTCASRIRQHTSACVSTRCVRLCTRAVSCSCRTCTASSR